ncbi:MAG: hypothetical protein RR794_00980 [Raoultibacter sp.]
MKKSRKAPLIFSFVLVAALGALTLGGCGGGASSADPKALYESKCGTCHSLSTVDNASYTTADQWSTNVKRMQAMTSKISDDDATKITDYLANR